LAKIGLFTNASGFIEKQNVKDVAGRFLASRESVTAVSAVGDELQVAERPVLFGDILDERRV
jgi:hypothetical protein